MPDATITSTASTFGTISGTFAADQSTVTGTISGTVTGTLTGSVGVPGPAGPGVPAGGTAGQYLQKIDGVDYNTDWVTLNLSAYAPLNSPVFTGDPQAPTPAFGDDDTSIATTAFVQAGLLGGTANAKNLEVYVRNQSGSTIPAGSIVYISGATGNRPLITLAQANNDANSAQTMGFTKTSIANNGFGYVIVRGELENIDTSALTEGAQLYLSPTTAGTWTTTKPSAPQHLVYVGIVVRAHPTLGVILVAVQNGYELNELHDVAITSPTNGQVLKYNSSTNLWVNGTDSSGVAWGAITGTLSAQTDLQTALDGKYSTSNPSGYITSSALTGYATESWVTAGFYPLTGNPSGFITSSALTPYLTSATAASTYQTIAGMSSYLTTSAAASTYYPLTGNPSGFITSSALTPYLTSATAASTYQTLSGMSSYLTTSSAASTYYPLSNPSGYIDSSALTGYATESWVTSQGYLTDAPSDSNQYVRLNGAWSALSVPADYITSVTSPLSVTSGDLSIDLTGYATESYVTSQGYITSSALSPYLTSATAASTYQTISGMNAYAPLASPALTGNPTAPTPATGDDDTSIATTAFVKAQGYLTTAPVTSVAGKTGAVTLVVADVSGAAPLASPTFTGTPAAPTATAGTSTTQLATTAFVTTADNLKANLASPTFTGTPAAPTATAGTSTTQIATTAFVTTADNLKANLASPAFTGTPTAPTATAGTNTTQIATTAFVTSAVPAIASITDSRQLTNTTKAMSPNDVLWAIQTQDYININRAGFTYTTSGTPQYNDVGSVTTRTRLNATGASSVIGRPFGVSQVDQSSPFLFRNNWTSNINFNLKTYLSGRTGTFALFTDATFNVAFYYGKVEGDAIGDLTRRGYGWKFTGGAGTRYVTLQVHNGTTLTNVTSSFAPTQEVAFDWDIYSDGVGNVTLYINGSQVATSNAGPTSYQSAGTYAWWREETWTTGAPSFGNHTSYFTRGRAIILNY